VPTELRHADNRKFAALSGEVLLRGDRTRHRRIVHQYPVRSRQDPMSLPKTLPFRRPLAIPNAERVWFGRFVFSVVEWLKMIWLSGNGTGGGEAASIRCTTA